MRSNGSPQYQELRNGDWFAEIAWPPKRDFFFPWRQYLFRVFHLADALLRQHRIRVGVGGEREGGRDEPRNFLAPHRAGRLMTSRRGEREQTSDCRDISLKHKQPSETGLGVYTVSKSPGIQDTLLKSLPPSFRRR